MGGTGLEQDSVSGNPCKDLGKSPVSSAAQSGAISGDSGATGGVSCRSTDTETDLDLALLVARWPTLSDAVKDAIMEMVNPTAPARGDASRPRP